MGIKGKYIHQSSRIPVLPSTISEECCVSQCFLIALDEILPSLTKYGITHPVCTQLSLLSAWNWLLIFQLPFPTYLISFYLYERFYDEIKVMNLSPYEVIKSLVTEFQSLIFFFFPHSYLCNFSRLNIYKSKVENVQNFEILPHLLSQILACLKISQILLAKLLFWWLLILSFLNTIPDSDTIFLISDTITPLICLQFQDSSVGCRWQGVF